MKTLLTKEEDGQRHTAVDPGIDEQKKEDLSMQDRHLLRFAGVGATRAVNEVSSKMINVAEAAADNAAQKVLKVMEKRDKVTDMKIDDLMNNYKELQATVASISSRGGSVVESALASSSACPELREPPGAGGPFVPGHIKVKWIMQNPPPDEEGVSAQEA